MSVAVQLSPKRFRGIAYGFTRGAAARSILVAVGCSIVAAFTAGGAGGDVGDLGPPPADPEVRGVLTDFYSTGHPSDSSVDVQFEGPIMVGVPKEHANPPLRPWCVRCGYPDQGTSPMYPVLAQVRVTVTQGLASSSLDPRRSVETTTTYNGTLCPGENQSQYCPAYYFYRDPQGNWQVA